MSDQTLEQKIDEATASLTSVLEPLKLAHAKLLVMNSELAELRRQRNEAEAKYSALLSKVEENETQVTISREAMIILVGAARAYLELDYDCGTSNTTSHVDPDDYHRRYEINFKIHSLLTGLSEYDQT